MLERIRLLYKLEHAVEVGPEHDDADSKSAAHRPRPQLEAMIERMKAWSVKMPPKRHWESVVLCDHQLAMPDPLCGDPACHWITTRRKQAHSTCRRGTKELVV